MRSPIQLDEDTDPTLIYAPPWAREREPSGTDGVFRSRRGVPATRATSPGKKLKKPKFSGDRAVLELRRQLALDPDLVPEPASAGAAVIRPLLVRLCGVSALAALAAWGLVSYSGVKKTVEFIPAGASALAIASDRVTAVDAQLSHLRPTISQTAEAPSSIGDAPPIDVASAEAGVGQPISVTAPAATEIASTPPQRAIDRRSLQLDSDEIAILIKRGKELLADGDLAAARLLLRRAAEAGSAEGALVLGTTFDPVALQRLGAVGAVPDLAQARQWYQRAAELGSNAASQQLAGLGDDR
jgi:hypothetical protein